MLIIVADGNITSWMLWLTLIWLSESRLLSVREGRGGGGGGGGRRGFTENIVLYSGIFAEVTDQ